MLNLLEDNTKELFCENKKTLIITVGNPLRSDDGAGPYIYSKISSGRKFLCLDAGDRPESIVDKATELKPERTVIIDAADFGGKPGDIRIIPEESIPDVSISTHAFPLNIIAKLIRNDTGSEVYFLGIQAGTMDFGEGLTVEVKKASDRLIDLIISKGD